MKTYTLSNAQLNILDTEMFYGNTAVNVLSGVCLFTDDFSVEEISDAINAFLQNNDGLRTRLLKTDDGAIRYVHPYQPESYEYHNHSTLQSLDEMYDTLAIESSTPMPLWDCSLYRFQLITTPDHRNGFVISAHHVICDAAILYEIASSIHQILHGTYVPTIPQTLTRSVAAIEKAVKRAQEYWTNSSLISHVPSTDFYGIAARRNIYSLNSELIDIAEKYATENELSLSTIIEGAYYLSIASALSKDAFNAGIMYMDRYSKDYESLPGCYAEVLPISIDTGSAQTFTEFCEHISDAHFAAYRHSVLPYRDILQCVRQGNTLNMPITNLYEYVYSYQVAGSTAQSDYSIKWLFNGCSEVPLKLSVTPSVAGFEIILDRQISFHNDELADIIFRNIEHILQNLGTTDTLEQLTARLDRFDTQPLTCESVRLNIAASFTAEPIEGFLSQWAHMREKTLDVQFAPYNQIPQMLLNRSSLLYTQNANYNIILFRAIDAVRHTAPINENTATLIADAYQELLSALQAYPADAPLCLVSSFNPDSYESADMETTITKYTNDIKNLCESRSNLLYLPVDDLCERYAVAEKNDAIADREGHIPYTNEYFAAIATHLWRKLEALAHKKHYKVLVVDCDNTLWGGVCGEVGTSGVSISGGYAWLQRFLVEKRNEGYLLAIASKNNLDDVKKVFSEHPDMILTENDISAWKVSWGSKAEAVRAIAAELNLGIDSFVFLDDSPVECSAMIAENPSVFTVQIPSNDILIPQLVGNLWCLDTGKATQEDRMRTDMYRAEREREQTKVEGESIDAYLSRLGIRMYMYPSIKSEIERIAQMTQRTNQFNMNGIRYTKSDIASILSDSSYECYSIRVEDKFGSYGLVGAVILNVKIEMLKTFVLSCRVLGRGIEHAVFAVLKNAVRHADQLTAHIIKTERNEPFLRFIGHYLVDGITADSTSITLDQADTPAYVEVIHAAPEVREIPTGTQSAAYIAKHSPTLKMVERFAWNTLSNHPEHMDTAKESLASTLCNNNQTTVTTASTGLVDVVRHICADILQVKDVDQTDNFFALGGDSLKAVAMVSRIEREVGVHVSIADLFQHPTPELMAAHLTALQPATSDVISHADFTEPCELSSAQLRMFILQAMNPASVQYNELQVMRVAGTIDADNLQAALNKIIARHEILRTGFAVVDGIPQQYLCTVSPSQIVHLNSDMAHMHEEILAFRQPFDLSKPPFIRMALLHNTDDDANYLLLDVHHIIIDGTSFAVLTNELLQLYTGYELTNLDLQYSDYVRWQKRRQESVEYQRHLAYWLEQYKTPVAPLTLGNEANRNHPSPHGATLFVELDRAYRDALEAYTAANNVTLFSVLLAAYALTLHAASKSEDFAIGIPVANRSHPAWQQMMGNFVNSLPIRISVERGCSLAAFVKNVFGSVTKALEHQECAYEQIVEKLHIPREANRNPLFDVMFSLQNMVSDTIDAADLRLTRIPFDGETAKNDLRAFGGFRDNGIAFELEYDANLMDDSFIRHLWDMFCSCVDAILHDGGISVEALTATLNEKNHDSALLSEYNNTAKPGYADHTVHALIHQQAVQTPHATAIVCNGESMTYAELEARASALALHLQAHGVNPGAQVGIIMPRSLELIVSLLAIMKAGACYVPADPIYPAERIEYMFDNSQVACVLTIDNAYSSERFACLDVRTLEREILPDDVTLVDTVQPEDLIYVLYTSGSTGKPKGVMVKHGAVCNFIFGVRDTISAVDEHRILATTTVCFDISVIELWRTLVFGGTIYLATDEERKDVAALKQLIVQHQINEINITPSQMSVFLLDSSLPAAWDYIKIIMIGGEAVPPSLLASMQKILPDTRIYNMYGPTETTIYSSIMDLTHEEEVSIGAPIANTRFYVVDSNMHVLPIGETGELCIAGDGLARGYMNRSDLTARQFVHLSEYDELVYKTGDLATMRSDLKMICHGRIDNQVKIRGYRIELEDVEQNILKTGLCKACTAFVIDSEHLGAIYTVAPDSSSDATAILKELGKSVPQYMVPSKLVQVDNIPLNANGKADRKIALALALEKHVPQEAMSDDPITDALLAIFRNVTLNESVCSTDQFFEAGGTSLGIFQVLAEIESVFGVTLQYADIYKDMTAKNLAQMIHRAKHPYISSLNQADAIREHTELALSNIGFSTLNHSNSNAVLVTGANGFLGIHLVRALLLLTDKTILCLVRSEDRLRVALDYYFGAGFVKQYTKRIVPVTGDITETHLGQQSTSITERYSIEHVYHTAADVRHFGSWNDSFRINTLGTKNVIEFCAKVGAQLHHVSTTGLSGIGLVEVNADKRTFSEHDLDIGQRFSDNVYIHSKYLAEVVVHEAINRGLTARIYRVGNLSERAYDGVHQMDEQGNAFLIRERAMKKLGVISDAFRLIQIEKTHIDKCADAICKLSLERTQMHTYHVFNPNMVNAFEYYTSRISSLTYVSDEEFLFRLAEAAKHDTDCAVMKVYIDGMLRNTGAGEIQVVCTDTLEALKTVRFSWEEKV